MNVTEQNERQREAVDGKRESQRQGKPYKFRYRFIFSSFFNFIPITCFLVIFILGFGVTAQIKSLEFR